MFFIGATITGPQGYGSSSKTQKIYYAPPTVFQHFNLGHKETLADLFWLRFIQDIDLCANEFSNADRGPVEIDPVSGREVCNLSWGFRMLDIVTDLAPRFRIPQAVGGINLSVLGNDFEGASVIFDKAVKNFPDDWPILYRAAYHFMAEGNDLAKAATLADRAAKAGAPEWLALSAAKFYSKTGRKDLGLQVLKEYKETLKDEKSREIVEGKIRALEAQKE